MNTDAVKILITRVGNTNHDLRNFLASDLNGLIPELTAIDNASANNEG